MRPLVSILAVLLLAACASEPVPAPPPDPVPPPERTAEPPPGPEPAPPTPRFYVHASLRSTDEAVRAFDSAAEVELAGALADKGWLAARPETWAELDALAASSPEPLAALAGRAPAGVRYLLVARTAVDYDGEVQAGTVWSARVELQVYDAEAGGVVFSGDAVETGSGPDDRAAAVEADRRAARAIAERLARELP